ncbi:FapA family protein [Aeromonas schubertii]|uniref:FapA family protein n=1 Tax=Aeromonas schubertii TaxID=652 RepID=UPI0029C9F340|nr:FapA family protein [Aeromonas schubertii]
MLDQSWLEAGSDGEDQDKLFLRLKSATSCSENQLQALLKSSPWHRWQPQLEGIKQAVARLNALQAAHELPAPIDRFCIAVRRDAQLKIQIDKDKMTAHVAVVADWGGEPLTLDRLQEAMAAAGVTVGQNPDLERQAVAMMHHAQAGSEQVLPIARGIPAQNGLDCRFESLVETMADRVLKPRELDNGRVDLRDLGTLTTVQAGTPLLRRHPATQGEPGVNVQGQPLPPSRARRCPSAPEKGARSAPATPICWSPCGPACRGTTRTPWWWTTCSPSNRWMPNTAMWSSMAASSSPGTWSRA